MGLGYNRSACDETNRDSHDRLRRAAQQNVKQVQSDCYFPKMTKRANLIVLNYRFWSKAMDNRHPKKQELGETPIPLQTGKILYIDIFPSD